MFTRRFFTEKSFTCKHLSAPENPLGGFPLRSLSLEKVQAIADRYRYCQQKKESAETLSSLQ
jgi:hypothetical protein